MAVVKGGVLFLGTVGEFLGSYVGPPQQHPTHDGVPDDIQKRQRVGKGCFEFQRCGSFAHDHGDFGKPVYGLFQLTGHFFETLYFTGFCDGQPHLFEQAGKHPAFLTAQFAGQHVHGLDSAGAFEDGGDFAIPGVLFHQVILAVTGAAVHLDGLNTNLVAANGQVILDGGCEHVKKVAESLSLFFGFS